MRQKEGVGEGKAKRVNDGSVSSANLADRIPSTAPLQPSQK